MLLDAAERIFIMKKYLLPKDGFFYKANLHCHTNFSDGHLSPLEVKSLYKKLGYSVVAYTDHDILIPHDELTDNEFLALHGFEMELFENEPTKLGVGKTGHICFIGIEPDNIIQPCWHRSKYLFANAPKHAESVKFDENEPDYEREYSHSGMSDIMNKAREKGFFVTYNHPTWSMEDYGDYMGYSGMHAFEMFNGGCNAVGYEDYNPRVYDDMLRGGKKIYCIGADDNHNHANPERREYDSGWAYTMIKADNLDYKSITEALLKGNFYASEGPEISELFYEDGKVYVKCSEADRINCNYGMIRKAETVLDQNGNGVFEACFNVPENCGYFRITVTDKSGKHACTNAYFTEDLK